MNRLTLLRGSRKSKPRLPAAEKRILDTIEMSAQVRTMLEAQVVAEADRKDRLMRTVGRWLREELADNEITVAARRVKRMTEHVMAAAYSQVSEILEREVRRRQRLLRERDRR
ncbi:MAG TPA: hypothetical protein VI485_16015 [Vicinamibacterales bacterium]|nr:hypothetical protein [Vicinamibacterales bacterium]